MSVRQDPGRIHRLPEEVIHRIAAGEVIDAPVSALKELIENALDAQATHIQVTLIEGGTQLIQVDDDGHGMGPEDLCACLERHATSKIEKLEDLHGISTLGYRGEALAAIASVSRLRIESSLRGASAWVTEAWGAKPSPLRRGLRRSGTRVRVENIFFNTPSRRKFLRRSNLEANDCRELLESLALAYPEVRFSWVAVDEQEAIKFERDLPPASPAQRFQQIHGENFPLIELDLKQLPPDVDAVRVLLLHPSCSLSNRKAVRLSVNGRAVTDRQLPQILRSACAGLIESGRFPVAHVEVRANPAIIDVNVHPQKKEIRLPPTLKLWDAVYSELRQKLGFARSHASSATSGVTSKPPFRFGDLRVLGQSSTSWIVCDSPSGLILIDQHAAHERVNFAREMQRSDLISKRPLLVPLRLKLPSTLCEAQDQLREALGQAGFECEASLPHGEIEIVAVPQGTRAVNWDRLLEEFLNSLQDSEATTGLAEALRVRVASSLACHGSIRRGDAMSADEIHALLRELDEVDWGDLCPHGRPVWFLLTNEQIAARFHR